MQRILLWSNILYSCDSRTTDELLMKMRFMVQQYIFWRILSLSLVSLEPLSTALPRAVYLGLLFFVVWYFAQPSVPLTQNSFHLVDPLCVWNTNGQSKHFSSSICIHHTKREGCRGSKVLYQSCCDKKYHKDVTYQHVRRIVKTLQHDLSNFSLHLIRYDPQGPKKINLKIASKVMQWNQSGRCSCCRVGLEGDPTLRNSFEGNSRRCKQLEPFIYCLRVSQEK